MPDNQKEGGAASTPQDHRYNHTDIAHEGQSKDKPAQAAISALKENTRDYLQQGWQVMRLPPRSKTPKTELFDAAMITRDNVDTLAENENLAVRFTTAGDLKDIDLDYQSAVKLARAVGMPEATASFGRLSVGIGHVLYNSPGAKAKKFTLPGESKDYTKPWPIHDDKPSPVVLEIRGSDNSYTVFPPSVHPCGETLTWLNTRRDPAGVEAGELYKLAGRHAFAAVVLHFYPENAAARYEVRMALAGALLRFGMAANTVESYVRSVARLGGDPKWKEDFVEHTEQRLEGDKPTTGLPKLVQVMQLPEACEAVFHEWLQIEVPQPSATPLASSWRASCGASRQHRTGMNTGSEPRR